MARTTRATTTTFLDNNHHHPPSSRLSITRSMTRGTGHDNDNDGAALATATGPFGSHIVDGNDDELPANLFARPDVTVTPPNDEAFLFSPHRCRMALATRVGGGGGVVVAAASSATNDGCHSHDGSNSNDRSLQHNQTHHHARKKKKNGLLSKFLGGGASGNDIGGVGGSGDGNDDDDAALGTRHLPIPFVPPPTSLLLADGRAEWMATTATNAAPATTATMTMTAPAQHKARNHHQQQQQPAKRLLLLNLEDVSILSSSVVMGGGGSQKTPFDESKTATTGSETQLSRDAQQVLGGLRKQRESREERKRAVLQQQAAAAASTSLHSSSHHKLGSSLASKVSGKSKSAKKNGINPDLMLGTVLMVPCGPSGDEEAQGDGDDIDDDAAVDNEADAAAERATGCWFPIVKVADSLSMVDVEVPATPTWSTPSKKKGVDSAPHSSLLPTSPEELFPGSDHHGGRQTNSCGVPAPASKAGASVSPNRPSSGGATPTKKPFVAPPPLMEDWSDDDEASVPVEEDDKGGAGAGRNGIAIAIAIADSISDAASRGRTVGTSGPGTSSSSTRHGPTEGAAAAVLRDYCSLRNDEDMEDEQWGERMGKDTSSSPKDVRHVFVASGSGTPSTPSSSGGVAVHDNKKTPMEESKIEEEEDDPLTTQHNPDFNSSPTASQASATHSPSPIPPPTLLRALTSWGPFTFPSSRSLETQFRQDDIAVAPNVRLPVRGVKETMAALRRVDAQPSYFVTTKCWTCETYLCCLRDAEFVLCPACRVVSPLDVVDQSARDHGTHQSVSHFSDAHRDESSPSRPSQNGVALGFTDSEWLQWRQQISLYEDGC